MTDLRQAAEMALEALDCLPWQASPIAVEATKALRQALAQQDKECVAIVNEGMGGIEWLSPPLPNDTPLYTAPQKREWKGLTDEEILDSADAFGSFQYGDAQGHKRLEFAKAIESKLKEKNT